MHTVVAILALYFGSILVLFGDSGVDSAKKYAYGENVGWLNAGTNSTYHLSSRFDGDGGSLAGFMWGENIGWVCFPTNGFGGVTFDASGNLAGYAWGENVGWINFPTNGNGGVTIDTTSGQFSGYAWGENIGWISFDGANHGVRTLAFDRRSLGTPNWWLAYHGVDESHDAGDGVPAWQKYVMDVSPTNTGNRLAIAAVTNDGIVRITFAPASTRRYYTLVRRTDLGPTGTWTTIQGQSWVEGSTGSLEAWSDDDASPVSIFAIQVEE